MIAPIQQTPRRPRPPGMRRAYRLVASTLLKAGAHSAEEQAPRVAPWRAWAFAAWVVAAVAAYGAYMLGVF